jgi:hypothetical protein
MDKGGIEYGIGAFTVASTGPPSAAVALNFVLWHTELPHPERPEGAAFDLEF